MVTKMQWLQWKMCDSRVAYCRTWSRRHLHRLRGRAQKVRKGPSLRKRQVKLPHQRSPYALNFEDRPQEES